MDSLLFVSTYMLQLPEEKQVREFLMKQIEEYQEQSDDQTH